MAALSVTGMSMHDHFPGEAAPENSHPKWARSRRIVERCGTLCRPRSSTSVELEEVIVDVGEHGSRVEASAGGQYGNFSTNFETGNAWL